MTPQGEELPVKWERLARPDVNTRAVYSYLGDFWVMYRLRFKREAAADAPVTLRFASSVGRVDFAFPGE